MASIMVVDDFEFFVRSQDLKTESVFFYTNSFTRYSQTGSCGSSMAMSSIQNLRLSTGNQNSLGVLAKTGRFIEEAEPEWRDSARHLGGET